MITKYKGWTIDVKRDMAMGGWESVYYYAMRDSDSWIPIDSFTSGAETVRDVMQQVKDMIDDPEFMTDLADSDGYTL